MGSKFFKTRKPAMQRSYTWSSKADESYETEELEYEEKKRIEAIPLEDVSFELLYKFPLRSAKYGTWVYDDNSNFVFQFEGASEDVRAKILGILNGTITDYKRRDVKYERGYIKVKYLDKWLNLLLIRGWGNLTGVGAYNLSGEYAAKIQDTFAEFIVSELKIN